MTTRTVNLIGRILLKGEILTLTGLRIGDNKETLTIGGVDLPVIRNRIDNQPYIPGSSLKGKMRSLTEKLHQAPQNFPVHRGDQNTGKGKVEIHAAKDSKGYEKWPMVNKIFGVAGDAGDFVTAPNRVLIRDIPLEKKSAERLRNTRTDLPYTEVKWEAAIDRVTSAATPRQIERVPAGAVFGPMEMVFSLYLPEDVTLFGHLLTAMQLLEDDYLGGHGSRGSGKIQFQNLSVHLRAGVNYQTRKDTRFEKDQLKTLSDLLAMQQDLQTWIAGEITPASEAPVETVENN